ncbi:MAG: succinate dehydrogenase, hydrophobic membrane anchor protein [Gammaproteobacteria bacterium]
MSFRTPLARARGLGSAKEGTGHWLTQRITAVALIPLTLWFAASVLVYMHADYATVESWIHTPWTAVLLVLLVATVYWHACLGLQVVIEDYVHDEWLKMGVIVLIRFVSVILVVAGIFVVLRIAFGG